MGKQKSEISNGAETELCKKQFKEVDKTKQGVGQIMEAKKIYLDYNYQNMV